MLLSFLERRKILKGKNTLELTPLRLYSYKTDQRSSVTIIIPKFKKKFALKYITPLLKSPDIKLNLDEYGSFAWLNMDGKTKVSTIVKNMKEKFGENFQQAEYRISKYITQLYEQRLITFKEIQNEEAKHG